MSIVAMTIIDVMQLGIMCINIILKSEAPAAFAASIYGKFLILKASALIILVKPGHQTIINAYMSISIELSSVTAIIAKAKTNPGIAMNTSVIRMITSSTLPP